MIALLLLQLISGLQPHLSPGQVQPTTKAIVCATPYAPDDPAKVPVTLWRAVLERYQIAWDDQSRAIGATDRYSYLAGWVVPSALGGVLDVKNLAPIPKASAWNLTRKQDVERRVYTEYCAGQTITTLAEAQNKAGLQWVTAWRGFFAP